MRNSRKRALPERSPLLRLSPSTTTAIALHAGDQSWILFVQCRAPGASPIKIEGVRAREFIPRTRALNEDNAFETYLIGLLPTTQPGPDQAAIYQQFADDHLREGWFQPSALLIEYIEQTATPTLAGMLRLVHPAAVGDDEGTVSIEEIAELLGVSVPTIRRMVKADQIPYLRWARTLRFVPSDVVASLQAR